MPALRGFVTMPRCAAVLAVCAALASPGAAAAQQPAGRADPSAAPAQSTAGIAKPVIVSRAEWRAKAAKPGMEPQTVTGIILHNTGVRKNPAVSLENKMRGLQSFSQNPGQVSPGHSKPAWPDVPYHFYIDATGRIAEGRDAGFAGDTNTNYKTAGFIQVVVEGDFEKEAPGAAQMNALRDLLTWLLFWNGLSTANVSTHKDHAATDCPGKNFTAAVPDLLTQVNGRLAPALNH
jgi:hypothetical protein